MRSFTYLLLLTLFGSPSLISGLACSSSSPGDQEPAEAGPDCGAVAANNEAECPATYDTSALPTSCAPIGLTCSYPGKGDGSGSCNLANLRCVEPVGDGGADAGQGRWVATQ
jgi:hypothetical protein